MSPPTRNPLRRLLRDFVRLCHRPHEDPDRWRDLAPFVLARLVEALGLPAGPIEDIGDPEQFPCWLAYRGPDGSRIDLGGPDLDGTEDAPAFVVRPGTSVSLPAGHHARTYGVLMPYAWLAPDLSGAVRSFRVNTGQEEGEVPWRDAPPF